MIDCRKEITFEIGEEVPDLLYELLSKIAIISTNRISRV